MLDTSIEYYKEYAQIYKQLHKELERNRIILLKKILPEILKHLVVIVILLFLAISSITLLVINESLNKTIFNSNIEILTACIAGLSTFGIFIHLSLNSEKLINKIVQTNKTFKNLLKEKFLPHLLKPFENLKTSNENIQISKLLSCELFENLQSYKTETDDCFQGSYKSLNFKIQECKILGAKNTAYFKGIIIEIDSNKSVKNTTILTSKQDFYTAKNSKVLLFLAVALLIIAMISCSILCFIFNNKNAFYYAILTLIAIPTVIYNTILKIKKQNTNEKFEKLNLEDINISKKFNAYSSDQIEGRYLLTTAFIDRFNNLKTAFGTDRIKCSFYDNKLYIAIATKKDLFELGNIFKPVSNQQDVNNFYNEISAVYKIIDYLKLDDKTGI